MKSTSAEFTARPVDESATPEEQRTAAEVIEFDSWCRIEITRTKPGLHEIAEGIRLKPIYRITWRKKPVDLFLGWRLFGKKSWSDKFVKMDFEGILLPPQIDSKYTGRTTLKGIEERAVFLSTHLKDASLTAIFAVRTRDSWFELHHWRTSWPELGLSRLDVCCF